MAKTPVMRGIPLDEAIQLGTRYAGEIERKGMPRAAQTMEALTMAATELEALRKRCEAEEAALSEYADPENWDSDGSVNRLWMEPDNSSRDRYHGYEHAQQAIAAAQEPSHG